MVETEGAAAEPVLSWPRSVAGFDALIEATQHRLIHFAFCRLRSLPDAETSFRMFSSRPIAIASAIGTWTM